MFEAYVVKWRMDENIEICSVVEGWIKGHIDRLGGYGFGCTQFGHREVLIEYRRMGHFESKGDELTGMYNNTKKKRYRASGICIHEKIVLPLLGSANYVGVSAASVTQDKWFH